MPHLCGSRYSCSCNHSSKGIDYIASRTMTLFPAVTWLHNSKYHDLVSSTVTWLHSIKDHDTITWLHSIKDHEPVSNSHMTTLQQGPWPSFQQSHMTTTNTISGYWNGHSLTSMSKIPSLSCLLVSNLLLFHLILIWHKPSGSQWKLCINIITMHSW